MSGKFSREVLDAAIKRLGPKGNTFIVSHRELPVYEQLRTENKVNRRRNAYTRLSPWPWEYVYFLNGYGVPILGLSSGIEIEEIE
jgi:hypothetical protein